MLLFKAKILGRIETNILSIKTKNLKIICLKEYKMYPVLLHQNSKK